MARPGLNPDPPLRRAWPWAASAAAALAVVVAGALLGMRLAGPAGHETAIGRVALEVTPSVPGRASAYVPIADWGFRADALDAPIEIGAELRTLDRGALAAAADGDLSLLRAAEGDLERAARAAVARALAWGAAGSLVLLVLAGALARRPGVRRRFLAAGALLTVAILGGTALAAARTFDGSAFASPTYYARGAELERILAVAEQERVESRYGTEFASILRSIGAILTDAPAEPAPGRQLYLVSDLHANPLVVAPLARFVGDDPVIAAGDFGQRGAELEAAALAPRVAALGERVVAVSGNHDSALVMERLAAEGVTVLDRARPAVELDGLRVAGWPDPLEWRGPGDPPDRPVTFDDLDDPGAELERAEAGLVRWFRGLRPQPDVVVVHQAALARHLAETLAADGWTRPLAILTGHDHRQRIDRFGRIAVVNGGSVGAGGAFDAGRAAIGFARLGFDPDEPVLESVELIAVEPFSGQAQGSRVVLDALCGRGETCSFEPPDPVLGAGRR